MLNPQDLQRVINECEGVKMMKYKVGDEVRVIAAGNDLIDTIGYVGKITEGYNENQEYYGLDNGWYYDVFELESAKRRGFQRIHGFSDIPLPTRATKGSAGYDLASAIDITIAPDETAVIPTGIKAYMQDNEYLALYVRSSIGKLGLSMVTGVSVVDSDYYDNPKNEGHIYVMLRNDSKRFMDVAKGTKLVQGIFHSYLCTDDDNVTTRRTGGTGSTGMV